MVLRRRPWLAEWIESPLGPVGLFVLYVLQALSCGAGAIAALALWNPAVGTPGWQVIAACLVGALAGYVAFAIAFFAAGLVLIYIASSIESRRWIEEERKRTREEAREKQ